MSVIETNNLTKFYGKTLGVKDLTLEVNRGEIFGFLGPNGAGKTTAIRLIMGFLRPTHGRASVFDMDSWAKRVEIKERVGYLTEGVPLMDDMTGIELLDYLGGFYHGATPFLRNPLCRRLSLSDDHLRRKVKTYSRGMRQKLGIVQALQHNPPLLILDEPTEGLDPLIQHEFLTILTELKEKGATIFLSSHVLSEVEKVCDRVGIIREGRLIDVQSVDHLRSRKVRRMEITLGAEVDASVFNLPGVVSVEKNGDSLVLTIQGDLNPVIRELARLPVKDLVFEHAHLDEIFMEYYREQGKKP